MGKHKNSFENTMVHKNVPDKCNTHKKEKRGNNMSLLGSAYANITGAYQRKLFKSAEDTKKEAADKESMLELVAPQIYDYFAKYDKEAMLASTKPQQLFMAYNGVGVCRKEMFNGNKISIITMSELAPGLRSVPEGIEVEMVNKLPASILKELIANFKAIYDRDKTESAAQVYRKPDGEYFVYYPVQTNNSANTNYAADTEAAVGLRTVNTIVMEAHSHAGMSAFFSGGDDGNEKTPLAYCVLGNFNTAKPSFVGRVKLLDQAKPLGVTDLFEIPEGVDILTFDDLPEASAQMLENAKPAVYARTVYGGTGAVSSTFAGYGYGGFSNFRDYDKEVEEYYSQTYGKLSKDYKSKSFSRDYTKATPARKTLIQFDVDWLLDNMSEPEAMELKGLIVAKYASDTANLKDGVDK